MQPVVIAATLGQEVLLHKLLSRWCPRDPQVLRRTHRQLPICSVSKLGECPSATSTLTNVPAGSTRISIIARRANTAPRRWPGMCPSRTAFLRHKRNLSCWQSRYYDAHRQVRTDPSRLSPTSCDQGARTKSVTVPVARYEHLAEKLLVVLRYRRQESWASSHMRWKKCCMEAATRPPRATPKMSGMKRAYYSRRRPKRASS
mmetsp:Transcript_96738/g.141521  ORF Transcript_96738/g.141521 Transcript_96738/m.141521 type:complete len:202 (+) Transcript_96738:809-1414(+)